MCVHEMSLPNDGNARIAWLRVCFQWCARCPSLSRARTGRVNTTHTHTHNGKNPPSCWFFLCCDSSAVLDFIVLLFVAVCTACVRMKLYSFFWCTEPGCRTSTHPRLYAMAWERTRPKISEPHIFFSLPFCVYTIFILYTPSHIP